MQALEIEGITDLDRLYCEVYLCIDTGGERLWFLCMDLFSSCVFSHLSFERTFCPLNLFKETIYSNFAIFCNILFSWMNMRSYILIPKEFRLSPWDPDQMIALELF